MKSLFLSFGLIALGVFLLFTQEAEAGRGTHGQFKGKPGIVDGDSLVLGGTELRILCIDAVELHQSCEDAKDQDYPCGLRAKEAMQALIGAQDVACYGHERDIYDRPLVNCYAGRTNLGREIVKEGWAVGTCRATKNLAKEAKEKGLGIWQGRFLLPKTWRKKNPWHKAGETPSVQALPPRQP